VENSGSKSSVFFGQYTYICFVCCGLGCRRTPCSCRGRKTYPVKDRYTHVTAPAGFDSQAIRRDYYFKTRNAAQEFRLHIKRRKAEQKYPADTLSFDNSDKRWLAYLGGLPTVVSPSAIRAKVERGLHIELEPAIGVDVFPDQRGKERGDPSTSICVVVSLSSSRGH
jgi:hypothetical protein